MSEKKIIWITVLVCSLIGGYIPIALGKSFLSMSSLLGNGIGGVVGIWLGIRLGETYGN